MYYPTLLVQKKKYFASDFSRWYSLTKFNLSELPYIRTEAQFCLFLFRKYGEGRFMCLASVHGRRGFFVFWIGNIRSDGFVRDIKSSKWVGSLSDEQLGVQEQDQQTDEYFIERERREAEAKNKVRRKRRGVHPWLIPAGRTGDWHDFNSSIDGRYQEYLNGDYVEQSIW